MDHGLWWLASEGRDKPRQLTGILRECGFRVPEIAQAIRVNRRTFERTVRSSFGISAGHWLRHERAVLARKLLRDGRSVKETGYALGFLSTTAFAREFKFWHEVAPLKYQQSSRARAFISKGIPS